MSKIKVGKNLSDPNAIANEYADRLEALTMQMVRDTEREYKLLFESQAAHEYAAMDASLSAMARKLANKLSMKWSSIFSKRSRDLSKWIIGRVDKFSQVTTQNSLNDLFDTTGISTEKITPKMREIISASVSENVDYIKSIEHKYLFDVKTDVERSIVSAEGGGIGDLQKSIAEKLTNRRGQVERRARNIALDQTRKAYNGLAAERMKNNGVTEFIWQHNRGSNTPRDYHIKMNGKEYSLIKKPVIEPRTGQRGLPGQLPYCRCTMKPVIRF